MCRFRIFSPLRGVIHFKPRPQNRILAPLTIGFLFKFSNEPLCPFYIERPPPGEFVNDQSAAFKYVYIYLVGTVLQYPFIGACIVLLCRQMSLYSKMFAS